MHRAIRPVYFLEIDGKVPFEQFTQDAQKAGRRGDIVKILGLLDQIAQGHELPPNANRELREVAAEDKWREFELRKNQTRVYYFVLPPDGRVVVLGEVKKEAKQQRATIARFRSMKAAYKRFVQKNEEE